MHSHLHNNQPKPTIRQQRVLSSEYKVAKPPASNQYHSPQTNEFRLVWRNSPTELQAQRENWSALRPPSQRGKPHVSPPPKPQYGGLPVHSSPYLKEEVGHPNDHQPQRSPRQPSQFEPNPTSFKNLMSTASKHREQLLSAHHDKAKMQMEVALQDQKIKKMEREKTLLQAEHQQTLVQLQALQKELASKQNAPGYNSPSLQEQNAALRADLEAALQQNQHLRRQRKELLQKLSTVPQYKRQIKTLVNQLDEQQFASTQVAQSYLRKATEVQRSKMGVEQQLRWYREQAQGLEIELKRVGDEAELYKRLHEEGMGNNARLKEVLREREEEIDRMASEIYEGREAEEREERQLAVQVKEIARDLESKEEECARLTSQLNAAQLQAQNASIRQTQSLQHLQQAQQEIRQLKSQLATLQGQYDALAEMHAVKEAEWVGSYEDEMDRLNQQSMRKISLMNGQLIDCGKELAQTQQLLAEHVRRGEQAEREKDALRANHSVRDNEVMQKEARIEELRGEVAKKDAACHSLRRQLDEMSEGLAKEQREHERTAEHYDGRLAEQIQRTRQLQRRLEQQQARRDGVEGELREYLQQMNSMVALQGGQLGMTLEQHGALQGQLAQLSSRYGHEQSALIEQQTANARQASVMDRLRVYMSHLRQRVGRMEGERQRMATELELCKRQIHLQREEIQELEERWLRAEEEKVDEVEKLKVLSEEERENYALMEEEALDKQKRLELQLKEMKIHEKKEAATEDNLRSLYEQYRCLQSIIKGLSQPIPLSIRKYTHHISVLHRPNYQREMGRIQQYGDKVGLVRQNIMGRLENMRLLFSIIDRNKPILPEGQTLTVKKK